MAFYPLGASPGYSLYIGGLFLDVRISKRRRALIPSVRSVPQPIAFRSPRTVNQSLPPSGPLSWKSGVFLAYDLLDPRYPFYSTELPIRPLGILVFHHSDQTVATSGIRNTRSLYPHPGFPHRSLGATETRMVRWGQPIIVSSRHSNGAITSYVVQLGAFGRPRGGALSSFAFFLSFQVSTIFFSELIQLCVWLFLLKSSPLRFCSREARTL